MTEVDLTERKLYANGVPHELFAELRKEGPVHRHPEVTLPTGETASFWSVLGHAEVQESNRDWERFSAADGPGLAGTSLFRDAGMLVAFDPPAHARLRKLISAGFTPRMVAKLEEHIATRAEKILDEIVAKGEDVVDFVNDVAQPLPMHVIADIVGIPEPDRATVFADVDAVLAAFDPDNALGQEAIMNAQLAVYTYAQQLSARKREHPEDDIWSQLTTVEIKEPDGSTTTLSEVELDAFFMILAVAGSETSRNALSQGLTELAQDRDQLQLLRNEPGLLPHAADEMLRWASPVLMYGRVATRDTELGGVRIAAGERVISWFPSANRDEKVFADPFRFDVTRDPNPHVSFGGGGAHYCLGASLARKEVEVMTGAVLRRFPNLELAGDPVWSGLGPVHNVGSSLVHMPVRLGDPA